jgi:hypothetical protein
VPYVQARLRAELAAQTLPLHGVSSGARGGDLCFASIVLGLGGRLTLLLPFPAESFKQTSVGQAWDDQFDEVLAHPAVDVRPPVLPQLPTSEAEQNEAFERCNELIVETLETLATRLHDPDPMMLAVYRSGGDDLTGGTADAIRRWTNGGRRVVLIDPLG